MIRTVLSARPKIADLVFQFYGRSLHPELFEVKRERKIERSTYNATIKITSTGHAICWQQPEGLLLTEVATSALHDLPIKRRLMSHRVRGEHEDRIECAGGLVYETQLAIETADNATIRGYQQELALAGEKHSVLYQFESGGRVGLGAFSYIHFESRARSLRIQALHTFPEDGVILTSQSLFSLPSES
ncbi:DUF2617 family protein [Aeoliella sp.]|uniref:DUF2617 family protein n=1 Tax=Aeoliella sp. TaxID=2795800 RepID=UPI003CCBD3DD